jgi:hypothetical protein
MNYSCLPNKDGSLKGSKTASMSVGMDIDFKAPCELSAEEQQKWLAACMTKVPEMVLAKKNELGLLMLERSAKKGYHLVFRRRPELSQEDNLRWASELLGVVYDAQAKDITRVFFTTTEAELIYLDDAIFSLTPSPSPKGEGSSYLQEQRNKIKKQQDKVGSQQNYSLSSPFGEGSGVRLFPSDYHGIAFKDIIAKYWEVNNRGFEPTQGDRDTDLSVGVRSKTHLWQERRVARPGDSLLRWFPAGGEAGEDKERARLGTGGLSGKAEERAECAIH